MNHSRHDQYAALVLRVALGTIYLAHSLYLKLMVFTLVGTAQYFESIGLSGFLAYAVFTLETAGGLALILGLGTRYMAAALVPIAVGAAWVHSGAGWLFTNAGGGWEFPAFLAVATVVQVLLGDGAFSLGRVVRLSSGQQPTPA